MRYIFIVQGEGRGHLTQAIALSQLLRDEGHEIVEVLVGKCSNRELPAFFYERIGSEVSRFNSMSINYGKKGKKGRLLKTIITNTTPKKIARWSKSIDYITSRIDKSEADVVVNFYELLLGFASVIRKIDKPIVNIAHQFLIDHPDYACRPKTDSALFFLRACNIMCSLGSTKTLALSFYKMRYSHRDHMSVVPPLLREEVFELESKRGGYLLGYMLNHAYLDEVLAWKRDNRDVVVHLFWDKRDAPDEWEVVENLWLHHIDDKKFLKYMERCDGYITTAGFESVCEAMYLGKPTLMIPAHIEQSINAADATGVGAGIVSERYDVSLLRNYITNHSGDTSDFREWVDSSKELFLKHLTLF